MVQLNAINAVKFIQYEHDESEFLKFWNSRKKTESQSFGDNICIEYYLMLYVLQNYTYVYFMNSVMKFDSEYEKKKQG